MRPACGHHARGPRDRPTARGAPRRVVDAHSYASSRTRSRSNRTKTSAHGARHHVPTTCVTLRSRHSMAHARCYTRHDGHLLHRQSSQHDTRWRTRNGPTPHNPPSKRRGVAHSSQRSGRTRPPALTPPDTHTHTSPIALPVLATLRDSGRACKAAGGWRGRVRAWALSHWLHHTKGRGLPGTGGIPLTARGERSRQERLHKGRVLGVVRAARRRREGGEELGLVVKLVVEGREGGGGAPLEAELLLRRLLLARRAHGLRLRPLAVLELKG